MKSAAFGSRLAGIAVLGLSFALPVIAANGRRHGDGEMEMDDAPPDDTEYPPTYFAHPEHRQLMLAHIALMTLAWVVFLPVGMSYLAWPQLMELSKSRVCANKTLKKPSSCRWPSLATFCPRSLSSWAPMRWAWSWAQSTTPPRRICSPRTPTTALAGSLPGSSQRRFW